MVLIPSGALGAVRYRSLHASWALLKRALVGPRSCWSCFRACFPQTPRAGVPAVRKIGIDDAAGGWGGLSGLKAPAGSNYLHLFHAPLKALSRESVVPVPVACVPYASPASIRPPKESVRFRGWPVGALKAALTHHKNLYYCAALSGPLSGCDRLGAGRGVPRRAARIPRQKNAVVDDAVLDRRGRDGVRAKVPCLCVTVTLLIALVRRLVSAYLAVAGRRCFPDVCPRWSWVVPKSAVILICAVVCDWFICLG